MNDIQDFAVERSAKEMLAVLQEVKEQLGKGELEALGKLADIRFMLNSSIMIKNMDSGNHLLGIEIDWNGVKKEIRIPPGGQQHVDNFSYLTMWFIRLHVDPPVRLTTRSNYTAFYQVNKLLGNGQNQQMQFLNPWPGASEVYPLFPGERLIVVPVGMHRYILDHDPDMRFLEPPELPQLRAE
jgi:hypothetical protein